MAQDPRKARIPHPWSSVDRTICYRRIRKNENYLCKTLTRRGGSSIQEFTAANPYYPPLRKPLGVRTSVWIHARRTPSVRRHLRPLLPQGSQMTARARSRIGGCTGAAADMSLRHYKVPVSPFVVLMHTGTTRACNNDRPLPCRSVAQVPRRLPSAIHSASTQATLPLYGI